MPAFVKAEDGTEGGGIEDVPASLTVEEVAVDEEPLPESKLPGLWAAANKEVLVAPGPLYADVIPRVKSKPDPDQGKPALADLTALDDPMLCCLVALTAIGQMRLPPSRLDSTNSSFSAEVPCLWTC